MENERHLAHLRWASTEHLHRWGWKSAAYLWRPETSHCRDTKAQSWVRLGGPLLCGRQRFPTPGRFHFGRCTARAGQRAESVGVYRGSVLGKAVLDTRIDELRISHRG